jgi:hypothetical protein
MCKPRREDEAAIETTFDLGRPDGNPGLRRSIEWLALLTCNQEVAALMPWRRVAKSHEHLFSWLAIGPGARRPCSGRVVITDKSRLFHAEKALCSLKRWRAALQSMVGIVP